MESIFNKPPEHLRVLRVWNNEWTSQHEAVCIPPLPPRGGGAGGEGEALSRARALRHNQTPHEQSMWQALRAKRFAGYKFRRQQALGHYFVDFVCFSRRLIIELDGSQHADATDYDERRDAWLHQQGFRVLRVWNNEWTSQREVVMEVIWHALQVEPSTHLNCVGTPSPPAPPPRRGEG